MEQILTSKAMVRYVDDIDWLRSNGLKIYDSVMKGMKEPNPAVSSCPMC